MPKPLFKSPQHLVKEWPEIFEDLYMNTMPVNYIRSLKLEFKNGRIWEIDVKEQLKEINPDVVSIRILDTFSEYKDEIVKINFDIDIDRLKKDIKESTDHFFKN